MIYFIETNSGEIRQVTHLVTEYRHVNINEGKPSQHTLFFRDYPAEDFVMVDMLKENNRILNQDDRDQFTEYFFTDVDGWPININSVRTFWSENEH
jgi:hypothetical protein